MNRPIQHEDWSKQRFEWKSRVNRSQHLSRGSKQLASCICDEYVSRKTGQCFPSNRTLAHALNVTERTVQRYLEELEAGGWIHRLKKFRRRRVIQLATRPCHASTREHDSKCDSGSWGNTTPLSPNDDTDVVPNKNQGNNQVRRDAQPRNLGYQDVAFSEENIVAEWVDWIKANTDRDVDALLGKLRTQKGFMFPRRFPADDPAEKVVYERFFDVISSERNP